LIKNIFETVFYEFFPGKCKDGKHPYNENSVYLSSAAMGIIGDCLHRANNNYDILKNTVYYKKKGQIQLLTEELKFRLTDIIDGKDFSNKFSHEEIIELIKNKTEIIEMIKELIEWIEGLKENELTIISDSEDIIGAIVLSPFRNL
jgi:hypothetical protein